MRVALSVAAAFLLLARASNGATHTWTGAASSLWSENANWTGGTPAGDPAADLVFPSSNRLVSTDDIPGVTYINSIRFTGSGYVINAIPGGSIALAFGIGAATSTTNVIDVPIALYSGVNHNIGRISSLGPAAKLSISGVISGPASDSLTVLGQSGLGGINGDFELTLSANNTYAGHTFVFSTFGARVVLTVMGFQPASTVTGIGQLSGTGTVGPFDVGTVLPGTSVPGILHSIGDGKLAALRVRLNGTTLGTQYDQLSIDGSIQLMDPELRVQLGFTPAVGDTFTILQATGGVTGTFGFAEGEIFSVDCLNFQIHYAPNAVVLTRVAGGGPPLDGVTIATSGSRTTCTNGTAGTVTVTDTGGCGNMHQWGFRTVSGGPITPISGATGTAYVIDGGDFPGTGTFYLVETTTPGFGSPVTSNELTITVVPPPTAVATGSTTICVGSSAMLSGSGASMCSWTPVMGLSDPNSCSPVAAPDTTTTYSLTVTGPTGCTSNNSAQVTVTVDPSCQGQGPLDFYTLPPCRIVDSRGPTGTYGAPALLAGTERVFPLTGQCGIPESAKAVVLNVTATNPSSAGHLTLYPADAPPPLASSMNFGANQTRANNATIRLDSAGNLAVFCGVASGSVDLILDVSGYYQ